MSFWIDVGPCGSITMCMTICEWGFLLLLVFLFAHSVSREVYTPDMTWKTAFFFLLQILLKVFLPV